MSIEGDSCQVCADWDHPCDACAKEIHQSWHAKGWWWIRPEACDVTCPAHEDTISRRLAIIEVTPQDRARDKQLRRQLRRPAMTRVVKTEKVDWHYPPDDLEELP